MSAEDTRVPEEEDYELNARIERFTHNLNRVQQEACDEARHYIRKYSKIIAEKQDLLNRTPKLMQKVGNGLRDLHRLGWQLGGGQPGMSWIHKNVTFTAGSKTFKGELGIVHRGSKFEPAWFGGPVDPSGQVILSRYVPPHYYVHHQDGSYSTNRPDFYRPSPICLGTGTEVFYTLVEQGELQAALEIVLEVMQRPPSTTQTVYAREPTYDALVRCESCHTVFTYELFRMCPKCKAINWKGVYNEKINRHVEASVMALPAGLCAVCGKSESKHRPRLNSCYCDPCYADRFADCARCNRIMYRFDALANTKILPGFAWCSAGCLSAWLRQPPPGTRQRIVSPEGTPAPPPADVEIRPIFEDESSFNLDRATLSRAMEHLRSLSGGVVAIQSLTEAQGSVTEAAADQVYFPVSDATEDDDDDGDEDWSDEEPDEG